MTATPDAQSMLNPAMKVSLERRERTVMLKLKLAMEAAAASPATENNAGVPVVTDNPSSE